MYTEFHDFFLKVQYWAHFVHGYERDFSYPKTGKNRTMMYKNTFDIIWNPYHLSNKSKDLYYCSTHFTHFFLGNLDVQLLPFDPLIELFTIVIPPKSIQMCKNILLLRSFEHFPHHTCLRTSWYGIIQFNVFSHSSHTHLFLLFNLYIRRSCKGDGLTQQCWTHYRIIVFQLCFKCLGIWESN